MSPKRYIAFAEMRISLQRSEHARKSVRHFRQSFDHSLLSMLILRGYYLGQLPTVHDCIATLKCSRMTTRRLLADAQRRGFIEIRPDPVDHRRKLVAPTGITVREYEALIDGYHELFRSLDE
jgi:DNA-binding MarR family transcriptional regulator